MSTASTMVNTIDTAVSNIVNGEVASVNIDGETYTSLNLNDLLKVRQDYADQAAAETAVANSKAIIGISGLSAGAGK